MSSKPDNNKRRIGLGDIRSGYCQVVLFFYRKMIVFPVL